jgi:hypothetical protein
MLEVRGIADYEKFSHLSGKSRRGEGDGAEFRHLMSAGEDGNDSRTAPATGSAVLDEIVSGPAREVVTYDISGRLSAHGAYVGRNLNVAI